MKPIKELLTAVLAQAFETAGFDPKYGQVVLGKAGMCDFQCNGAMAAAKEYKLPPFEIAQRVIDSWMETTATDTAICDVELAKPGFINFHLQPQFIAAYLNQMNSDPRYGCDLTETPIKTIIDYGGPNVAKPLHVGHLRPAIIGEALKRIGLFLGHEVIGDVHLGDWGLPIGLIITELKKRKPHLPYFDDNYTAAYPCEVPFTMTELEEIYPYASSYSKTHPQYMQEALQATYAVQHKQRGYYALWQHIVAVSVADIKRNYDRLDVHFELWKGESDVDYLIPEMAKQMKQEGHAYYSDGALIVDVTTAADNKELPPCIILKSDGAALYSTTDLATILERTRDMQAKRLIYVVDKRQALHFEQIFRCAKKTNLAAPDVELVHIGFGTMNGADGKPFKTRSGEVMRLEQLLADIAAHMEEKIQGNDGLSNADKKEIAAMVALAALKYGDLSNLATKDYIFDIERLSSFEGNTGPYILYSIIRIRSILRKYSSSNDHTFDLSIGAPYSDEEREVMLKITNFCTMVEASFNDYAPHKLCSYIYEVANAFNAFYHANKILTETDTAKQRSWIALLQLIEKILTKCIHLLGFDAPDRM
jgi:arginyl-tRNA synthetase